MYFLLSLDTTDNAAVEALLWQLTFAVLPFRLKDGLIYRLQKLCRQLLMSAAPELNDVALEKTSIEKLKSKYKFFT